MVPLSFACYVSDSVRMPGHDCCCVPQCKNWRDKCERSFPFFPKLEPLRSLCISAIKRHEGPTFKITSNTVVSRAHFAQQDFFPSLDIVSTCNRPKPMRLRSDAVPSVFSFRPEKVCRPSPPERRKAADLRLAEVKRLASLSKFGP